MHEDELPANLTDEQYAEWFAKSLIPGGVGCRVGPVVAHTLRDMQANNYARALAVSLHGKHFAEVTQWEPLPDTLGLLTQIDNMVSGLERRSDEHA